LKIAVAVMGMSVACIAGSAPTHADTLCSGGYHPYSILDYATSLWEQVQPLEKGGANYSIVISDGFSQKIAFRFREGLVEVWRFAPQEDVLTTLKRIESNCQLPGDPKEAIGLLGGHWERKEIPAATFQKIHGEFLAGLQEYVKDAEAKQYSKDVEVPYEGPHVRTWRVTYRNNGFFTLVVTIVDGHNKRRSPLPLSGWVRRSVELAEELYQK